MSGTDRPDGAPAPGTPGVARNSGFNLVAFASTLAMQFLTIPFVVRWTGLGAFGEAGLVLAVCAPLTLVGTVIGQALTREIAAAGRDPASQVRTFAAALRLCLLASGIGWLLLVLAGPPLLALFRSSAPDAPGVAFLLAASGWVVQQVALVIQGLFVARQDFRTVAQVTLASALLSACFVLGVTWVAPTANGFLAGQALGFLGAASCWAWAGRRELAQVRSLRGHDRGASGALLRFGRWQAVSQVAGALANQADRYVLGALATAAAVGQFTAANRLQEAAYIGIVKAGEVLFPRFGSMAGQGSRERASFFQLSSWVLAVFSAAMLGPMVVLADDLLLLWIGPQAGEGSGTILRTLVLGGMLGAISNVFSYYAMALGRTGLLAWLSIVYSVLTIIGTVVLIGLAGPLAAGTGLLLATLVRIAMSLWLTRYRLLPELEWQDLVASTVLAPLAGIALALTVVFAAPVRVHGWAMLCAAYAGFGIAIGIAAVLATACLPAGRRLLHGFVAALRRAPRPVMP